MARYANIYFQLCKLLQEFERESYRTDDPDYLDMFVEDSKHFQWLGAGFFSAALLHKTSGVVVKVTIRSGDTGRAWWEYCMQHKHPNLPVVYDVTTVYGYPVCVMEKLHSTLADLEGFITSRCEIEEGMCNLDGMATHMDAAAQLGRLDLHSENVMFRTLPEAGGNGWQFSDLVLSDPTSYAKENYKCI